MKTLSLKLPIIIPSTQKIELPKPESKRECNHIIDDIYLSGFEYSLDYDFLKKNNFTHIINCAVRSKRFKTTCYDDFEYLKLDILDEPGYDIELFVQEVINFIEKAGKNNNKRKILIHCYEGVSRGPTLLTSYIMWKYGLNKDKALELIKEKRNCVDINLGFLYQLERISKSFVSFPTTI